ncbi:hypothetical protein AB4865_06945 [Capnocytophaga sp. ARDL2]|uniref:hypothetical protein n=1 Tax=Capnocytophaga sp. ARDL2 TaxID=3238809 RepID=UPI0035583731
MKYITILMLFITTNIYSQEVKNSNFIIVIDEEIVTNSLGIKLLVTSKDGNSREIETITGYYPGNISLKKSDYDDLISDETQSVILKFNYQTYINDKSYYYTYEIEAGKNWFEMTFVILKIYNLDKRKYRKKLDPLSKDKNYTFDLETSNGQMIRIRKR